MFNKKMAIKRSFVKAAVFLAILTASISITSKAFASDCADSDGGQNYNVKGYVNLAGYGWDYCSSSTTLMEQDCGTDINSAVLNYGRTTSYTCPNGCVNGACIPAPSIKITSPNGGEKWEIGKTYNITWTSTGYDKVRINVTCEGYSSGAIMNVLSSATGGSYSFTVPSNWSAQSQCKAQVSENVSMLTGNASEVDYDMSDNYFSIIEAITPSIRVVSPNGGDNLIIGETKRVFWSSVGVGYIRIYIYDESISGSGSTNYIYENAILASVGYYDWTIQKNQLPGSDLNFPRNYKIRVDGVNSATLGSAVIAQDQSDNNFSIDLPKTPPVYCYPDNTLIKLPNDPKVYIIINCKKYWVKSVLEFKRKGYKWENIKIANNGELNSLPEGLASALDIKEGAMIRVTGTNDIYIVKYIGNKKFIRLILNPSVFRSYGHLRWEDVIDVNQETLNSFAVSNLVRSAKTGKIYQLDPNGDIGVRKHFKNVEAMKKRGNDLDAVYEINETDENSYEQGEELE